MNLLALVLASIVLYRPGSQVTVHLGAPPATSQLPCYVAWEDIGQLTNQTLPTPGSRGTTTSSATPVVLISAPSVGARNITWLTVRNADSASVTAQVTFTDELSVSYALWAGTLQVGDTLQYTSAGGFSVLDNTGRLRASYRATDSLEVASAGLHLVGDAAVPGASKVYGTDGSGVRGWYTGGSGGAPTTATYKTQTPDASLSAEEAWSLLGSGLVLNTTGTGAASIYAGTSCTNQFPRSLSASGAATCASVDLTNDTSSVLPLAKLTDDASSGLCLLSGGAGDPAWTTCPGGGGGLSYAQVSASALAGF